MFWLPLCGVCVCARVHHGVVCRLASGLTHFGSTLMPSDLMACSHSWTEVISRPLYDVLSTRQ